MRFILLIIWILCLCLVPVAGHGQSTPAGQSAPAADSTREGQPRILKSVRRLIARAPFNPLNRQHPPARPVTVLPAQNTAKLLQKIKEAMKAKGYLIEAYRPDSLFCRVSKATNATSKDKYLLWLESPTSTAAERSVIKVFVQYGNFIHFWGTPVGQESAAMTSVGEYEKKVKLLKSVLDTMPR